jgi:hypothetical protein
MICKTFILTKSDISSHIHIMYIQLAKESIEYKVVMRHFKDETTITNEDI